MLNIVADENIPRVAEAFGALGNVRTVAGRTLCRDDLAQAEVLLVRSVTPVNAALLAGTPVRFVGSATSGTDHVALDELAAAGIAFAAAPGANANSVVEYVLAAIAATEGALESLLNGGRAGVVGYGHVGRLLASRLRALGIDTCVSDPWLGPEALPAQVSLDEVLGCDVVSVHAELTDEQPWPSRHLIGESELRRMAPGSLLINASRGAVVDNRALLEALSRQDSPTVVLDVWEGEPDIDVDLLARVAIGTAHIAGYSFDGKLRGTAMLLAACAAALGVAAPPGSGMALEPQPLTLAAGLDTAASLRSLVQQRYDILQDDRFLRAAATEVKAQANSVGQSFDRLRRDYRERRELAGSTVALVGANPEQQHLVSALGCTPDTPR
jgi:erythronate-4-phosphate dehydrogenase